ncbi:MAG: HesA/MoeB/ThiF family protein [Candidatus Hermodarchaeia archaeon]|jgi:adenylyltransferase/sulfurtransferase
MATEDRYSRFRVLEGIGAAGMQRIHQARVAVVGIGGLGSVSARQLTSLGVGLVRVVDRDIVEVSNLQRQLLYTVNDIGTPKVEVAMKRLNVLNSDVTLEALALSVTEATADRVVEGMDVVIDGLDSFKPRYALNRACIRQKIPYVFAGALSAVGNMTTVLPRKTACLECVFGGIDEDQPTCATVGIYPTVLGVIANLQVQEALRIILGHSPLLANQLLMFDINRFQLDQIPIQPHDDCPVCGRNASIGKPEFDSVIEITELCTEETFLVHSINPVPIDIGRATVILHKQFPVIAQSKLGVQIQYSKNVEVSIVGEGNILVKGVKSSKKAEAIYHQILTSIADALIA